MRALVLALGILVQSSQVSALGPGDATTSLVQANLQLQLGQAAGLAQIRQLEHQLVSVRNQINQLGAQIPGAGTGAAALGVQRGQLLKQRNEIEQRIYRLKAQHGINSSTLAHNHAAAGARLSPGAKIAIVAGAIGVGVGVMAASASSVPDGPSTVGYPPSQNPPANPTPTRLPGVEAVNEFFAKNPSARNQVVDLKQAAALVNELNRKTSVR